MHLLSILSFLTISIMKRLCVDARLFSSSGIGTFLKIILNAIRNDPSLDLVLLHYKKDKEPLLAYTTNLIEIKSLIYSLKEQIELPLKIPKCSLFVSPHFNIPLLPIRAKKRLTTIHDVYHLAHSRSLSFTKWLYAHIVINAACLYSDHVMTVSAFSYSEILAHCHISPNRLTQISLGVRNIFKPVPMRDDLKQKYQLPDRYLLSVSNFKSHKNLMRLLEAYKRLNTEIGLVLVGGKRSKFGGSIISTGHIEEEDLPALYSSAEAFVFPSLYEGFGLPPLEAMACGCPVIAAKTASLPEVCSSAAEYVDPLNIDSIKQGMAHLLNSPKRCEELKRLGFERAQELSEEKAAAACMHLIREML